MIEVKNISRYWVDKGSGIIVRKWTDEEYKSINPHAHIFEKYWYYYCPKCNFVPIPHFNKDDAKHGCSNHKHYTGHRCLVNYKDFELGCLEFKEEYSEEFGVWVAKQTMY